MSQRTIEELCEELLLKREKAQHGSEHIPDALPAALEP